MKASNNYGSCPVTVSYFLKSVDPQEINETVNYIMR